MPTAPFVAVYFILCPVGGECITYEIAKFERHLIPPQQYEDQRCREVARNHARRILPQLKRNRPEGKYAWGLACVRGVRV